MGGIFICYRREDAAGYVHALRDRLAARLGSGQVFMDIDSIEPGLDFVEVIEGTVKSCSVVLTLIGKRWMQAEKLQDSRDFVRLEIQTALEKKIRVIPVLLDGAEMPKAETLPAELAPLSRRQAYEISNRHFNDDVNQLGNLIERILRDQEPKKEPPPAAFDRRVAVTSAESVEKPNAPPPSVKVRRHRWGSVLVYTLGIGATLFYAFLTVAAIEGPSFRSEVNLAWIWLVVVGDFFLLLGWALTLRRSSRAWQCFLSAGLWQIVSLIVLSSSGAQFSEHIGVFSSFALAFFLLAYRLRKDISPVRKGIEP